MVSVYIQTRHLQLISAHVCNPGITQAQIMNVGLAVSVGADPKANTTESANKHWDTRLCETHVCARFVSAHYSLFMETFWEKVCVCIFVTATATIQPFHLELVFTQLTTSSVVLSAQKFGPGWQLWSPESLCMDSPPLPPSDCAFFLQGLSRGRLEEEGRWQQKFRGKFQILFLNWIWNVLHVSCTVEIWSHVCAKARIYIHTRTFRSSSVFLCLLCNVF